MPDPTPRVMVAIPTKNAGPRFQRTLEAIRAQDLGEPFEMLVIDSGSTDGTLVLCQQYGVRVTRIAPRSFNHGRARNLALTQACGEYVALTVQDAIPANEQWLGSLVAALDRAPDAAGAYARQIPQEGAGFIARQVTGFWHNHQGGRVVQRIEDRAAFERLSALEKQRRCAFDNVSSIVRRSAWERIPFREIAYAEDLAWGYDVLRAGWAVIYEPAAVVYHSHERPWMYQLRRSYIEAKTVGELLSDPPQPLAVRDLAALWRLWREIDGHIRQLTARPLESLEDDLAPWIRRAWGVSSLRALLGDDSPLPESERMHLVYTVNRRHEERTGLVCADHNAADRDDTAQSPRLIYRRLDRRILEVVRGGDDAALLPGDLEFICDALWAALAEVGATWAILSALASARAPTAHVIGNLLQYVHGFAEAAQRESALTPALYAEMWHYAAATAFGQRLGAANRCGASGRWGRALHAWLGRGV